MRALLVARGCFAAGVLVAGCGAGDETVVVEDAGGVDVPRGSDLGMVLDLGRVDADAPTSADDAQVVSVSFPSTMTCASTFTATVVVRNVGTTTWARASGYRFGAVGDLDPLHAGEARISINAGDTVPPGATHQFDIPLTAPVTPGTYSSRWQMVHEPSRWFGEATRRDVRVECAVAPTDSGVVPPPDAGTPPVDAGTPPPVDAGQMPTLDLHDCTLSNNPPDLADWAVTTRITDVEFQYGGRDGMHVEFSRRDGDGSWPDVTPPGWDGPLQYTVGLAENIGGRWYCSAAIQFWRGLDASGGNLAADVDSMGQCTSFGLGSTCQVARNWYYDGRWGALAGYQPATGEWIGVFVVAGNVRGVTDGSQSPVHERSNIVMVRMPDLGGGTYRF